MKKENQEYNYRNCQSLFDYAQKVHERSGGICQLCESGGSSIDFDLWRQMTVEHLIGESQGGYLHQIKSALANQFPEITKEEEIEKMAVLIDEANTVTTCSFCNSTTSHNQASKSMEELIAEAENIKEVVEKVANYLINEVLPKKQKEVEWKLKAIKEAFHREIEPGLRDSRNRLKKRLGFHRF
ncbi:MAG: hypothetical protein ACRECJ_02635 [Limisphaerales bacterium]